MVLGVEASGTGSRVVLMRGDEVVSTKHEGPLNVLLNADAFDRLASLIKESGCEAAGLGIAGIRGDGEVAQLEAQLRARTGVAVVVGDDTEVALLGAFNGGPGIVMIAATGSQAFGRNSLGRAARVGGYGNLLGDEGSHYWIASQAIRAALQSRDGRGPKTKALEDAVASSYGLDLDGVVRYVHSQSTDLRAVARVARPLMLVNDPVMVDILQRAADDLVKHVEATRKILGDLPVAMVGAVFLDQVIRKRFVEATGAIDPIRSSEFGAVLLATSGSSARQRDMGW
jgi:N-acetylglucosamine kinase-like BadF-type ATPase